MASRILLIANKNWEVDPLVSVLRSEARPKPFPEMGAPVEVEIPTNDGTPRGNRSRLGAGRAYSRNYT